MGDGGDHGGHGFHSSGGGSLARYSGDDWDWSPDWSPAYSPLSVGPARAPTPPPRWRVVAQSVLHAAAVPLRFMFQVLFWVFFAMCLLLVANAFLVLIVEGGGGIVMGIIHAL